MGWIDVEKEFPLEGKPLVSLTEAQGDDEPYIPYDPEEFQEVERLNSVRRRDAA